MLELPSMAVFESYLDALEEGFYRGMGAAKTKAEINEIKNNPKAHLESLNSKSLGKFKTPSGEEFDHVPYENLWIVADDLFIGEISFRHELNQLLADFGGHVGYGVRPSLSGQGLATLGCELLKKRAASMGIEELLITCSPENPASKRVIEKCGGEFIDISPNTHGFDLVCYRYSVATG